MSELRVGDIVRLEGPPWHSATMPGMPSRCVQPGDMGVIARPPIPDATAFQWVDFPMIGEFCIFTKHLHVVGHVDE